MQLQQTQRSIGAGAGADGVVTPASCPEIGIKDRAESLNPGRYVVIPVIGAVVDVYLLTQLDSKALILGGSWLAIGIVYLLVLTRGFTRQPPDLAGIAEAD